MTFGKAGLALEFALLFVALPLAYRFLPFRFSPLPALWVIAAYCLWVLSRDPNFDWSKLWNARMLGPSLREILVIWIVAALVMTLVVWTRHPAWLFRLVREHPFFWLLIMALYPVLSVYPQGIIYRAFLCHRYQGLFGGMLALMLVSAAAFSFSHIIFRSYWSVGLTLVAGLLFAWRYLVTGSLLASSFEHALYGCYVFTVGLGSLFYHGAGRAATDR